MSRSAITSLAIAFATSLALPGIPNAQTAMGGKGKCKSLKVNGKDMTRHCAGKMLNTSYPDGRVGFYFVMTDGQVFTFSGYDRPNPTPDTDVVAIDKIIFGGAQSAAFAAFGKCTYGNFYKGYKTISCRATAQDGSEYRGLFELTAPPTP